MNETVTTKSKTAVGGRSGLARFGDGGNRRRGVLRVLDYRVQLCVICFLCRRNHFFHGRITVSKPQIIAVIATALVTYTEVATIGAFVRQIDVQIAVKAIQVRVLAVFFLVVRLAILIIFVLILALVLILVLFLGLVLLLRLRLPLIFVFILLIIVLILLRLRLLLCVLRILRLISLPLLLIVLLL